MCLIEFEFIHAFKTTPKPVLWVEAGRSGHACSANGQGVMTSNSAKGSTEARGEAKEVDGGQG